MPARASCLLTLLLVSASALGATRTWTGAGGTNLWSNAANWDSGVPVDGDDLVFPASETQNDLAGLSINSLTVDGTQGAIAGNSIVLDDGLTAGGRWDIALPIQLGGSQTWAISYGPAFYPETTVADVDLASHDLTIVVTGSIVSTMDLALNGDVTGTGSLEIQSLGRSRVTVNGEISAGPVTLKMENQGQISLLASNTFDGPLHARLGANTTRLVLGADDAIPQDVAVEVESGGGQITFSGPFSIDVASFDVVTGRATLRLAGGVLSSQGAGSPTFAGPVAGSGTIKVTGGTQTFTDNEYPGEFSGSFVVEDGQLILTRNQSANWGGLYPDVPVSVDGGELGLNGAEVGSIEVTSGLLDLFPPTDVPSAPSRCDALELQGASRFRTRLNTPLLVGGPVSLGSAELELLSSGAAVSPGQVFVLIDNAGASPTGGTFAGLPEGAEFSVGDVVYRITYAAGSDGKDVAVTVVSVGPPPCPPMTSSNVSIGLAPPSPCAGSVCPAGEPVAFRVQTSGYDLACAAHTFVWDFGDGTVVSGSSVAEHVFEARTEPYLVSVTIANGAQTFETEPISITAIAPSECGSLQISPSDLPDAHVDRPYAQTITVEGGQPPYTIALKSGSLPRGLTLDDGVLAGIPTRAGQYRFIVRATDATDCERSRSYLVTVLDAQCPLMIPNQNLFVTYYGDVSRCTEANGRLCVKGEPIHFSVIAAEGYSLDCGAHDLTWELGDGTSGSGNPVVHEFDEGGTYTVTVHVANEAQEVVLSVPVQVAKGRRRATPHR